MTVGLLMLFKGVLVGLSVSIPLGPMGLLCINRTLHKGHRSGFLSGMGAATADTIFAVIAILGIGYVINFIEQRQLIFELLGGLMVLLFGIRVFLQRPRSEAVVIHHKGLLKDFLSVLFITLSNPVAIFLFAALFAGFNLAGGDSVSVLLVPGVFLGATLWWFMLSSLVSYFKTHIQSGLFRMLNRLTGGLIAFFGLLTLLHAFTQAV